MKAGLRRVEASPGLDGSGLTAADGEGGFLGIPGAPSTSKPTSRACPVSVVRTLPMRGRRRVSSHSVAKSLRAPTTKRLSSKRMPTVSLSQVVVGALYLKLESPEGRFPQAAG